MVSIKIMKISAIFVITQAKTGAAYNIFNLRYKVSKEISMLLDNGSNYD